MNIRNLPLALTCVALLAGCATKDYVNEQVAGVNKRIDGQQTDTDNKLGQTASLYQGLENRVNSQQTALDGQKTAIEGASRTAQEALDRANAAGKLAAGKFLYETTLTSQVTFKADATGLSDDMKKALDAFIAQLKEENRNVYIEIQGHTDSIGTPAANLALGEARAEAVRRYLAMQGGIALHRMSVISYGETAPVASNMNRAGRAQNRRVTLVVLQ
jgi:outer membrane protein OmpA-like peptidoglycan-associated protein